MRGCFPACVFASPGTDGLAVAHRSQRSPIGALSYSGTSECGGRPHYLLPPPKAPRPAGAPVVAATVTLQGRTVVTSVTVYYGFDSNMTAGLFQVKVTHPNYVDYERTAEANRAVHKYISYIAARVVVTRQHRSDSVGEEDGPRQNTADGARVRLPRHGWAGRC